MSEIDKLREKANKARNELYAAEAAERDKENAALAGHCFKYRNSYSCPKPDEHWWLYSMVMGVEDGVLRVFSFQTASDNQVSVEMSMFCTQMPGGHIEISREEFDKEWRVLRATLGAIVFPEFPSPSKTGG